MPAATTTVRIPSEVHMALKTLSQESGRSMVDVLVDLIDLAQRQQFFEEMRAAYDKLQDDTDAHALEQSRLSMLDSTSADGLEGQLDGADSKT